MGEWVVIKWIWPSSSRDLGLILWGGGRFGYIGASAYAAVSGDMLLGFSLLLVMMPCRSAGAAHTANALAAVLAGFRFKVFDSATAGF